MDFISNFNGLEIFFILVLALIIFGPERLPAIGAKLGEYTRMLQQVSAQIMEQWRQEVGLDNGDGKDVADTLRGTADEIKRSIQPVEKSISAATKPGLKSLNAAVMGAASTQEEETQTETTNESQAPRDQILSQRVQDLEQQLNSLKKELAQIEEEDK